MRIQLDVEKAKAGRRVGVLLAALVPLLCRPAMASEVEPSAAADLEMEAAAPKAAAGWQEVYYGLILVERMAQHTPQKVGSHQSEQVLQMQSMARHAH